MAGFGNKTISHPTRRGKGNFPRHYLEPGCCDTSTSHSVFSSPSHSWRTEGLHGARPGQGSAPELGSPVPGARRLWQDGAVPARCGCCGLGSYCERMVRAALTSPTIAALPCRCPGTATSAGRSQPVPEYAGQNPAVRRQPAARSPAAFPLLFGAIHSR